MPACIAPLGGTLMPVVRLPLTISTLAIAGLIAGGCNHQPPDPLCTEVPAPCVSFPAGAAEKDIAGAFAQAKAGTTFVFASGTYALKNSLDLAAVAKVTIKGQGSEKTILDFKGQGGGADALLAEHTDGITVEDLWVRDPAASAVRVNRSDGVFLRRLKVSWTSPDVQTHGPYGLYPVLSRNVVIEDSSVTGGSDSGICASQLTNALVRRNQLSGNVAGLIVRNAHGLDVLDNEVHDNSVGIVIGTLPGDEQLNGHDLRIAGNRIVNNNVPGFNRQGETIDLIPSGAALVLNGNTRVEVFGNTITGNKTSAISVVSLIFGGFPIDPGIDPFPSDISIHDNTLTGNGASADLDKVLGQLLASGAAAWAQHTGGRIPDIFWDGIVNPLLPPRPSPMGLCIRPGSASFANLHADQLDPMAPDLSKTVDFVVDPFLCKAPLVLPPVVVPGA